MAADGVGHTSWGRRFVEEMLLFTLAGLFAGSLPFSVWAGRLVLKRDIRDYGDRNPGTSNAWRAGGWALGLPVAALEVGKAALPIGLAHLHIGNADWRIVPVALAPIVGHSFSPFLRFRGGKAVACTFGAWIALAGPLGALLLAVVFGLYFAVQAVDAWTVVFALCTWVVALTVWTAALPLIVFAVLDLALVTVRHGHDLRERARWRRLSPRRRDDPHDPSGCNGM